MRRLAVLLPTSALLVAALALLVAALSGCSFLSGIWDGYFGQDDSEAGGKPAPDFSGYKPTPTVTFVTPEPTPKDPSGGLERDEDGILIGSVVFDEPILLIGMPREDPESRINVRKDPSLDAGRVTQILIGEVVEAFEVVDGWYRVSVYPDMIDGYIRSDLLVLLEETTPMSEPPPDDIDGSNVFHGDDPSGLRRGPNGVLIGSADFDEPMLLMGMSSDPIVAINVREWPSIESERLSSEWGTVTIGKGQVVEAYGVENGWYRVRVHPGMFIGYIRSDNLVQYDGSKKYLAENISNFDTKMGAAGQYKESGPLVDLRTMIPDIEYSIIFATPENFTGKAQYSRDVPLLHLKTAQKLKEAQELFKQDGYRIKLYDAYRPSSVSGRLSAVIRDTRYIARAGTSTHNRAAAVDMTLVDKDGNELEMPSPMHTFNSTSHRDSKAMSEKARENMDYMTGIMQQVGMSKILTTEWWHFGDSDSANYLPLDIEFRDLIYS